MAAGRARGELAALDEGHPQAAQREVVRERAAGAAAADDQHVWRRSPHLRSSAHHATARGQPAQSSSSCPSAKSPALGVAVVARPRRPVPRRTCPCSTSSARGAPPPGPPRSRRGSIRVGIVLRLAFGEGSLVLMRVSCSSSSSSLVPPLAWRAAVAPAVSRLTRPSRTCASRPSSTCAYCSSRSAASILGVHSLSLPQFAAQVVDRRSRTRRRGPPRTRRRAPWSRPPSGGSPARRGRRPGTASAGRCAPCRRRPSAT